MTPPASVGSKIAIALVLGALAALMSVDLAMDVQHGTSGFHAVVEGSAIAAAAIAVALVTSQVRALSRETHDLRERERRLVDQVDASRADAARWRGEASAFIEGLGVAIDQQFERWGLTAAEKEIALLLLKGLEHKEIAALREVGETTVRQQARSVYRKAGLSGRHDLAAFFLEDLLGPRVTRESARPRPSRSETT